MHELGKLKYLPEAINYWVQFHFFLTILPSLYVPQSAKKETQLSDVSAWAADDYCFYTSVEQVQW